MNFSASDHRFMAQALQLAERGRYTTRPNPRVGCVITSGDDCLAEGWHYRAGQPHAEVNALSQLSAVSPNLHLTAYVTLEPCSHEGKTGPCAQALIDAGISRVVYAMEDPNPLVSGRGLSLLRQANIRVEGPLMENQARLLNEGFVLRMQQQRPLVRAKLAMSLDGRTAMASGESQWITGAAARQDVQRWRAQSCAVITGMGSIRQDNSRLNLRKDELLIDNVDDAIQSPPLRVIIDAQLTIDISAAIFVSSGLVLIFCGNEVSQEKIKAFSQQVKADVVVEQLDTIDGHVDLFQLLRCLAEKYQCNEVLLEAGAGLSGAFLQAGLLDEVILYQAPVIMGSDAKPLFDWPLQQMQERIHLIPIDQRKVGDDWRMRFSVTAKTINST